MALQSAILSDWTVLWLVLLQYRLSAVNLQPKRPPETYSECQVLADRPGHVTPLWTAITQLWRPDYISMEYNGRVGGRRSSCLKHMTAIQIPWDLTCTSSHITCSRKEHTIALKSLLVSRYALNSGHCNVQRNFKKLLQIKNNKNKFKKHSESA